MKKNAGFSRYEKDSKAWFTFFLNKHAILMLSRNATHHTCATSNTRTPVNARASAQDAVTMTMTFADLSESLTADEWRSSLTFPFGVLLCCLAVPMTSVDVHISRCWFLHISSAVKHRSTGRSIRECEKYSPLNETLATFSDGVETVVILSA